MACPMNVLRHLQRNKILIDCILHMTSAVVLKVFPDLFMFACRRLKGVLILADCLIGQGAYYFWRGTKFVWGGFARKWWKHCSSYEP